MVVGFSQLTYSMMEEDESGDGSVVEVCLVLTGGLQRRILVSISTMNGSAAGTYN